MADNAQQQDSFNVKPWLALGLGTLGLLNYGKPAYRDPTALTGAEARTIRQGVIQGMNYDAAQAWQRRSQQAAPTLGAIASQAAAAQRSSLLPAFGQTLSQGGLWGSSLQAQLQNRAAYATQLAVQKAIQDYLLQLLAQESRARAAAQGAAASMLNTNVSSGASRQSNPLTDLIGLGLSIAKLF